MSEHESGRLSALLVAEACNPEWASVPLVGWSHSRAIAALTDAHLVTHVRNRDDLARAGLVEGRDFTAIDSRALDRPLAAVSRVLGVPLGSNKGWTVLTALSTLSYYYFERLLWRRFGCHIRRGDFDVVHRITPLSPATPSPLARHCRRAGVAFVLGPLNGGLPWPPGFLHVRLAEREFLGFARGGYRLLPSYASTRACAAAIVVGSRRAWAELPARYRSKTTYIPENGIDPERFCGVAGAPYAPPLRVAYAGRLVPVKGVDMLLEAAAPLARAGKLTLDLIGDGTERARLAATAGRAQIASAVRFTGWIEHRQVREKLQCAHVFAFPSIRDFGGAAVLEAMALGLVPIVLDHGGPAELVSPQTGFVVPMGRRGEIVLALRRVLERLISEPSLIPTMGARAHARVRRSFTWAVKAAQVLEVYRFALGRRERPDFGMPYPDPPEA